MISNVWIGGVYEKAEKNDSLFIGGTSYSYPSIG